MDDFDDATGQTPVVGGEWDATQPFDPDYQEDQYYDDEQYDEYYDESQYDDAAPVERKRVPVWPFVLIGAIIVALGAAAYYWYVLLPGETPTQNTPTMSATEVGQAFMQAIADGDSAAALRYSMVQPSNSTFLTDEILAASNLQAPITNIVATLPSTPGPTTAVDVSYTMGDAQVTASIPVTQQNNSWLVTQATSTVNLTSLFLPGIGLSLNGVPLDSASARAVQLFPGTYQMTLTNQMIALSPDTFAVTTPGTAPTLTSVFALSDTAQAGLSAAAQSALTKCFAQKSLGTSCGFGVSGLPNGATANPSTITWSTLPGSGDLSNLKFELSSVPTVATAPINLQIKMICHGTNGNTYQSGTLHLAQVTVDFSDPSKFKVTFN